jgi:hypothetical protein
MLAHVFCSRIGGLTRHTAGESKGQVKKGHVAQLRGQSHCALVPPKIGWCAGVPSRRSEGKEMRVTWPNEGAEVAVAFIV